MPYCDNSKLSVTRIANGRDHDVIVIGAGLAGLAATETLLKAGLNVVCLEADAVAGGRVRGEVIGALGAVDVGGSSLYGPLEGNALANALRNDGGCQFHEHRLIARVGEGPRDITAYFRRCFPDVEHVPRGHLVRDDRLVCLDPEMDGLGAYRTLFRATYGADSDSISVADYLSMGSESPTWRPSEPIGVLVQRFATRLPVRYHSWVKEIDFTGRMVRVVTRSNELTARFVLFTGSIGVLASNRVLFRPGLPRGHRTALAGLRMGLLNKCVFPIPDALLPGMENCRWVSTNTDARMHFHIRPGGRPLVMGFVGGSAATALERRPSEEQQAWVLRQFNDTIAEQTSLAPASLWISRWGRNRQSLGAYAHALPGRMESRDHLCESIAGRLFFAGEACAGHWKATMQGAFDSGERAALKIAKSAHDRV